MYSRIMCKYAVSQKWSAIYIHRPMKNNVLEDLLYIWVQAFEIFIATSTAHNDQSLICIPFSCFWLNVMSCDQILYNIGLYRLFTLLFIVLTVCCCCSYLLRDMKVIYFFL